MSSTSTSNQPAGAPDGNPYIGPRAFKTGERIYGRDREARQLTNLIVAERIVLLYSPSGAGKTSLIQAAVLPQLQKLKFHVHPVVRVNLDLPGEIFAGTGANRYVLSALLSLDEGQPPEKRSAPDQLAGMSLAEYLSTATPDENQRGVEVVIFDQFEEILTLNPADQDAKEEFFRQVGEALDAPNRWALFSMREDYLAALDPYRLAIPNHFRATYRLDLLGVEAARQAIQQPARDAGVEFEQAAADQLVDDLRRVRVQRPDGSLEPQLGPYVEPVQLQVVCYRLWESPRSHAGVISSADLPTSGQIELSLVDQSLADYYEQCVQSAAQQSGVSERAIRDWMDRSLITEQGLRGTVVMGPERSGGLDNRAIWSLVNAHLVRGEKRAGATWFELAHDRLLAPVRESNTRWRERNLSLLQRQAALWVSQGRPDGILLRGKRLQQAEAWAEQHRGEMLDTEVEFLDAGRKQDSRESRARLLNRVIAVLGVVAILLAFIAYDASVNAGRQAQAALAGQLAAQSQAGLDSFPIRSLLLALEAVAENEGNTIRSPAAEEALRAAITEPHGWYLYGAYDAVTTTAFSPDGRWLATGSEDGVAHLYEMGSVEPGATPLYWLEHDSPIRAMAFDPQGRWLGAGYKDGSIRLWDLRAEDPEIARLFLLAHTDAITAIDFSPDGHWLASGSLDGTLRVWDLQSPSPAANPAVLPSEQGAIETAAFSPDGRWLAATSGNMAYLWDMQAGEPFSERNVLAGHFLLVQALAFSPDGHWLATGSRDRTTHLWDLTAPDPGSNSILLTEENDWVNALAFSPDSAWLATGSGDGIARLWHLGDLSGDLHSIVLAGHDQWIQRLAFSPDGSWLATGGGDHTVRLWDVQTSNPAANPTLLRGHDDWINTLAFSPDSRWLVTGGQDQSARLWELPALHADTNPITKSHGQAITTLGFSPEGTWLAIGASDVLLYPWQTGSNNPAPMPGLGGPRSGWISAMAFSADGRWLASASGLLDFRIRLLDLKSSDPWVNQIVLQGPSDLVNALVFSPDGHWLASGGRDNTIQLWNMLGPDPNQDEKTLTGHQGAVNALAFSPDGRWLASGSGDNEARLWDLESADPGADPIVLSGNEDDIFALAFSPDGRYLATAGGDQTVRVWKLDKNGTVGSPMVLRGHEDQVRLLAFSPDGNWLISGSWDETVRLWDFHARNPEASSIVLRGHEEWVTAMAVSADSRWLATGSLDKTIRLWDLSAKDPALFPVVLSGHDGGISTLAFSPDGRWLASGGEDGATRLWLVRQEDLKPLACRSAGRNLTSNEWVQYFPDERYHKTCQEWTDTPPAR